MNNEQFQDVVQLRQVQISSVLCNKAKEYASTTDRLHNFKVAARRMDVSPEVALRGMMEKHAVSVDDMIEATTSGVCPTKAMVNEKIGDFINYLILLEALFVERINETEFVNTILHSSDKPII